MMTDSEEGFKSSSKLAEVFSTGVRGSLALRVFYSTILFLVIPLFIYALVVYHYNFVLKKSEEGKKLELIAENQNIMFSQLTQYALQRLEIFSLFLDVLRDGAQPQKVNGLLQNIKQITGEEGFYLLKKETQGNVTEVYSSGKIGPNNLSFLFSSALDDSDYSIHTSFDQPVTIYFIKVLARDSKKKASEILTMAISTQYFMRFLTATPDNQDKYILSLFRGRDHKIFASQEFEMIGRDILFQSPEKDIDQSILLEPINGQKEAYYYVNAGKHQLATILPLALVDFSILVTVKDLAEDIHLTRFLYGTGYFLIVLLVFGGAGSLCITFLLAAPLKKLIAVMREISENRIQARYAPCRYGFEINKIGLMLNTMTDHLILNLNKLDEERVKKEKLEQELEIGQEIQKSLVPKELPEVSGLEIETLLIPAKQVGGDFYDFFIHPQNKDELILVIADTAGHGVFGCFYSLTMRSILRSLLSVMTSLSEVIKQANRLFYKDSQDSQVFVTTWIGSYNMKTHVLSYSSCGHPLGFLFRKGVLHKELITQGIALGVLDEIEPTLDSVLIEKEDVLVLVTDGLTETKNQGGELFGRKRFIKSVETHLHLPLSQFFEHLISDVESFEGDPLFQDDDLTAVAIKINN